MTTALSNPMPELVITPTMRTAANTVAASFHAYQQSCFDMQSAKDAKAMQALLRSQRERKNAYHLALKFLSTATFKENPDYNIENHQSLDEKKKQQLQQLFTTYLEQKLNALIKSETEANGLIRNTSDYHPVILGPW